MNKGAVWLRRNGMARIRLRKASFLLKPDDVLELFYDPKILSAEAPQALCLMDCRQYSVWSKPANLLTQGTDYGDHASLLRQVETFFSHKRRVYPVHRLDREVEGLIMVAHLRRAAGKLSRLFAEQKVVKRYCTDVFGTPVEDEGIIDLPLDGKHSVTKYRVVFRHPDENVSRLVVEIGTGRLHQIRRHLAAIGHPVMGDPRYGRGNKDGSPLRLTASELTWVCPFTGQNFTCNLSMADKQPNRYS
jgi:tRNA pseudouridine32 synthase / 23S rRNA pseudouridine746 synthase